MFIALPTPPSAEVARPASMQPLKLDFAAAAIWEGPGRGHVFSDAMEAGLRDRGQWFIFDPSMPSSKATQFIDLPDKAISNNALSTFKNGHLYANNGRVIFRRSINKSWSAWFKAERPFTTFEVIGDSTVVLIGNQTAHPHFRRPEPPFLDLEPGRFKATSSNLIEIWDTENHIKLHYHPIPDDISALANIAPGLHCQIFTIRCNDDILIYLEGTGHVFHLNGTTGRLEALEAPWKTLRADYLQALYRNAKPGKKPYTPVGFLPTAITFTPAPDGAVNIGYWDQPLNQGLFDRTKARLGRYEDIQILCPNGIPPQNEPDRTPYGNHTFHTFTWNPVDRKFRPFKGSPILDPNQRSNWDTKEGRDHLNELLFLGGAFLSHDGDILPMRTFIQRIRALHKARTGNDVPKPVGLRLQESQNNQDKAQTENLKNPPTAKPAPQTKDASAPPPAGPSKEASQDPAKKS